MLRFMGSNPGPLHWKVDSQPLDHQGSPSGQAFNCLGGKTGWGDNSPLVFLPSSPTGPGPSLLSLYPDEDTAQPRSHFQLAAGLAQAN